MNDREAMHHAIAQAHLVEGRTSPRPPVGAVVVRDGVVVGSGATSPPYGPHAEIHALNEAGQAAQGADLYVTLEPCCITVHTPPCTQAIIHAGVRRVVIGSLDPNPHVHTRGLAQLRDAGIEVVSGIEAEETGEIIRPFATFITKGRPYVTAKWAMTLDGKLASKSGDSFWISGPEARVWVHNLRDRVDAILIGAGTARTDNPQLTVRLTTVQRMYQRPPRQGPLRIVLSTDGKLDEHLAILQPDLAPGTWVITGENCSRKQSQRLEDLGASVIQVALDQHGHVDIKAALHALAERGVMHLLLEGGAALLGSAFDQSLIDHVAVFVAPRLIGGTAAPSPLRGKGLEHMREAVSLKRSRYQRIGDDILIEGQLY
jgi:diaminohydroxyphosphoribosylaminopyrimidine deaminase/5-amino-6-(5-phosphoribosylamino)uracil reductase